MSARTRKCSHCPTMVEARSKTGLCVACLRVKQIASQPAVLVAEDRVRRDHSATILGLKRKYEESLKTIARQEKELQLVSHLGEGLETFRIEPRSIGSAKNEGTVVAVASDWHVEERVGVEVGGLNIFNLDIAKDRATKFFQATLRLTNLLAQDITINTIVLALLGDFISNDIHEEFPEVNEVAPMHALVQAQNFLISGIEFLLRESDYELVIPCHSGNHARTTRTTRFSRENGHSLEYLMYLHLAAYFRNEPRVTFQIAQGMHSYLQVYDTIIRFQHGHAIKYGGGVGGIYIPVNKAIAQWDRARPAHLNVFGHFHQALDGGNFVANGSLIGYNSFALSIKASFEPPKQQLFLLDKKRGRTAVWPIFVQ